ncbi:MAG: NAD-dependent epimerase/dehydratase family protein, partial [bacterium]
MSFRKIRTCFVTGGTGFIGSHLVDLLLENGCEVRCLVRNRGKLGWLLGKPVTVFEGDLGSHGVLRSGASGVDAVFHLAGLTAAASREQYRLVNAGGCGNLARASLEADEPPGVFVYVSSLAAVGPSYNDTAVEESRAPHPVTEYGRSKLEGERVLAGMGPLPLVVVRPPAVYGPRDREILPLFRLAARGFLPIFNPAARISMVHVRDLVKGILASAEGGRAGETYFLAHPQAVRA